jgi:hypothetical protein
MVMPLVNKKGSIVLIPKKPEIGSEYMGHKVQFFDGRCGTYWESHPEMGYFEEKLQRSLLKKEKRSKLNIPITGEVTVTIKELQ